MPPDKKCSKYVPCRFSLSSRAIRVLLLSTVLPSLDYSSSDVIFTLSLWLPKELKLLNHTDWWWALNRDLLTDFNWISELSRVSKLTDTWYTSGEWNSSWEDQRNPASISTKGKQRGICCSAFPLSAGWSTSKCFELLWTHGAVKWLPLLLSSLYHKYLESKRWKFQWKFSVKTLPKN